jgi:phosphohistidine phosphatase
MDLYLLRHGIAVERGLPGSERDFDRPLTDEGEQKLRRMTKALRRLELSFDLVWTSPYLRARQTAELVAKELELRKSPEECEALRADRGNPREVIAELMRLSPAPDAILLVGHEPSLSTLASFLISGIDRSGLAFKKAGLCKLSMESIRSGRCAQLEWLVTPRQMLLMA